MINENIEDKKCGIEENEFIKKIRLQKALHSYYENLCKPWGMTIKVFLFILPAIVTFLAFSDLEIFKTFCPNVQKETIYVIISLISFVLFILTVLSEIFNIDLKCKLHRDAINRLVRLRDNYMDEFNKSEESEKINITKKYKELYYEIIQSSLEFTDGQYLKGMEYYVKRTKKKIELKDQLNRIKQS